MSTIEQVIADTVRAAIKDALAPIFERLDALPDTTTLEELNAIIHEAVN